MPSRDSIFEALNQNRFKVLILATCAAGAMGVAIYLNANKSNRKKKTYKPIDSIIQPSYQAHCHK